MTGTSSLHMELLEQLGKITEGLALRLGRVEQAVCALAEDESIPEGTRLDMLRCLSGAER